MRPRVLVPVRGRVIAGGPAVLERELLRHLPAAAPGWRWILLAAAGDPTARELAAAAPAGSVRVVTVAARPGLVWDQLLVPRLARRLGADAVFSAFSALPAHGPFARVLVIPGGDYFVVPDVLDLRNRLKWHLLRHLVLPAAHRVICLSERHRRDVLAATGLPPERLVAIHPGISDRFRPRDPAAARARLRARFGLEGRWLLFVGHLFPNKGLETLLAALARLRDAPSLRLVVAGGVRWGGYDVAALARHHGVAERVVALGPVPQAELPTLFVAAEALVVPSRYESFGFVAAEAMACGCPVVLSTGGALPEVGGDAALYFPPGDDRTLAARLRALLGDADLRARLRRAGPERARRFRWSRTARATVQVLAEAMAPRTAAVGVRATPPAVR